jgi:nucleotide-binding universal stress UspA family protein
MAKRMLVPLDASPLAESIVPVVADVARGAGATVRLLHVAPLPRALVSETGQVIAYLDQEMERLEAEGMDYLRAVEVQFEGIPVECVVRFGDPVQEILLEAEAFGADLIAVATAGRSGLGRTVLGSVAEQVFRKSRLPVVLYHPGLWGSV